MKLKKVIAYIMSLALLCAGTGFYEVSNDTIINASEIQNSDIMIQAVLTYSTDDSGNVTVTGCSNAADVQEILIPDMIEDKPVTAVAEKAFYDCKNISSIILGKNLVTIGAEAFYGSALIEQVTIPENVKTIGEYAFGYTTKCMIPPGLMTMFDQPVINDGFTVYGSTSAAENYVKNSMESNAFKEYIKMYFINIPGETDLTGKTVDITDSISCVVDDAGVLAITGTGSLEGADKPWLSYGTKVSKIVISEGITDIPDEMFTACVNAEEMVIPDTVESIGAYAFKGLEKMTKADIPAHVTKIGIGAFYGCSSLESAVLPVGVTEIPDGLFYGCKKLASAVIPDTVSVIGEQAFYECESLKSIKIPEGIQDLKQQTFMSCSSLDDVTLPESLIYIGKSCFQNCISLQSVDIPENIKTIGQQAFASCSTLQKLILPDSMTVEDRNIFNLCGQLSGSNYPKNLKVIFDNTADAMAESLLPEGTLVLDNDGRLINNYDHQINPDFSLQDGVLTLSGEGFLTGIVSIPVDIDISKVKKLVISDGITGIGENAFRDVEFTNLNTIEIADSVKYIGPSAFAFTQNNMSITNIDLGNGVVYIGKKAFSMSTNRAFECKLPDSLVYIDDEAFMYVNNSIMLGGALNCDTITVPAGVSVIGEHAIGYQYNSRRTSEHDKYYLYTSSLTGAPQSAAEIYSKYNNIKYKPVISGDPVTDPSGRPAFGDINNDTNIDMKDMTMLSQYLMHDISFTDEQLLCADVINDDDINLADLSHFKQYIMMQKVTLGVKPQ